MTEGVTVALVTAIGAAITGIAVALINRAKNKDKTEKKNEEISLMGQKIYQCNILITFIPTWLITESKYDAIPANATDEELKIVSSELLQFVYSSIYDQWSAAFFKTSYDKIPTIETLIIRFREKIQEFYNDLQASSKNQDLLKMA